MCSNTCIVALISLIFAVGIQEAWSQHTDTTMQKKPPEVVTFIAKFDAKTETKDGYYLNGYLVNIDYAQAKKLDGKKIRVTGIVSIVEGLQNQSQEVDAKGNPVMKQGRAEDIRCITTPKIDVVGEE